MFACQVQYNEQKGDWDNEAYLHDGLQPTTRERAAHLYQPLLAFLEMKTNESIEGCNAHNSFHLLRSLHILLDVLNNTVLNMALHGPSVARGLQRGGEKMTLPNGRIWSTKVNSQDDMPLELMSLIEQYLELNWALEWPGLGTHTNTQTHYSPTARRASSTCQQCKQYQWLH